MTSKALSNVFKLNDVVNVKDPAFGAKGDGVTDDTTAVQAALNTGKSVLVPAGEYRVTSALYVTNKSGFVIEMQGALVPYTAVSPGEWEVSDTTDPTGVLNLSGCTDFSIIPRFNQSDASLFGNGNIIYLDNCQRFNIKDGFIDVRCNDDIIGGKGAIRIGDSCKNFLIHGNYLRSWYGVFIGGGTLIPSPYWTDISGFSIYGNTIVGNEDSSVDGGIGISIDCPNASISLGEIYGNTIRKFGNLSAASLGIAVANGKNINIFGNTVEYTYSGIHCEDGASGVTISNNKILESRSSGIRLTYAVGDPGSSIIVSDNLIENTAVAPVHGILAIGAAGAGLSCDLFSIDGNTVINSSATPATGYGIYGNLLSKSSISNNKVRGAWTYGLTLVNGDVGLNSVNDNLIDGAFSAYCIQLFLAGLAMTSFGRNRVFNTGAAATTVYLATDYPILGRPYLNQSSVAYTHTGSEVILCNTTLLAKTMPVAGEIVIEAFGITAANANNKQVKLYLGSTAIYDSGAVAANNKNWNINVRLLARTSTTQKARVTGSFNGTAFVSPDVTLTENLATDLAIKVTALCVATTDVTNTHLGVEIRN